MKKILLLFGLIISSLAFSQQYVPAGGVSGKVLGSDDFGQAIWQSTASAAGSSGQLYFVTAATTSTLAPVTYSSGTLTAVSNGRLANQDGIKLMLGDSLLVKNQVSKIQNGIYIISDTGTVSTTAKMYRSPRYDIQAEVYPSQVNVFQGTVNGGAYFIETTVNPVVGTSPLVFLKSPNVTNVAGTGISVVNGVNTSTISLAMCISNTTNVFCNNIEIGNSSINPNVNRLSLKNGGSAKLSGNSGQYLNFQNSGTTLFNTGNLFHSNTGTLNIGSTDYVNIQGQGDHTSLLHGTHGSTVAAAVSLQEDSVNIVSDTGGVYIRSPEKIVLTTTSDTDSINLSRNPPMDDNSRQIATTAFVANSKIIPSIQTISTSTITPNPAYSGGYLGSIGTSIVINNPAVAFSNLQSFLLMLKDNGSVRTISFGTSYVAEAGSLPSSTTSSKTITIYFIYNPIDSKYHVWNSNEQ